MPSSPGSDDTLLLPTVADVTEAAARLAGIAVRTPLLESDALNEAVGGRVLIKAEPLQVTGSFKFRGAYNRISRLADAERPAGIVAYSSGNHAQGVAAAAKRLGIPAIIVMPENAPAAKLAGTSFWGAEVVTYDRPGGEDRLAIAAELARSRGAVIVPPYDDPFIVAGQGTVGLEIAAQTEALGARLDAALAPVGGGGLIAGTAMALHETYPGRPIYAVEPEGFDDTARSLVAGERRSVADPTAASLCDALTVPIPGVLTFEINRDHLAGGFAVSDAEVAHAMRAAFSHLKLVIEPGGAVALAAVLAGRIETAGKTLAVVASGGNVDAALYARLLAEA
jgi:threonine dehydratase